MMGRVARDRLAAIVMAAAAALAVALAFAVAVALIVKSQPILATQPAARLLLSSAWRPSAGQFGFYPFLVGTLWVSGLAMALAIPVSLLSAVYLTEYAPGRVRGLAKPLLDLLAGIPPVVFGLWGVLAVVPAAAWLSGRLGHPSSGYSVLAGATVLAIMVFPIIISVAAEVIVKVPVEAREASLALGATRWQTSKHVVLRAALPGVLAALILGFSRAFGETMAVLMVVGNVRALPRSVFDPAYPLPALIANNYGEMMSIPGYGSALMFAALILLSVVVVFNLLATVVLRGVERRLA
jgi:phosphate transport system permease protein